MNKVDSARQDVNMQMERLAIMLDDLYKNASNNLGETNVVTKRALKCMLYLHALKCDLKDLEAAFGVETK